MDFIRRLEARVREADSLLCVGLDPHPSDLPDRSHVSARDFCLRLIESTADQAAAFKPNAAFFELYGAQGVQALKQVIDAVPQEIPVILDAKRGDIASTAQAYAQAAFVTMGADAITANAYLGYDSIEPFIQDARFGVFLLCKTSNPGAGDLQDLVVHAAPNFPAEVLEGLRLYEVLASYANKWNRLGNIGLVVGATKPQALERVRKLAPDLWILAPGVGAQGGDLKAALEAGMREDGLGMLLPVSRGISRSQDPAGAARDLRQQINHQRGRVSEQLAVSRPETPPLGASLATLADALLQAECVKFGDFTLKSGLQSPIYIDLRRLVGFPSILVQAAQAYIGVLKHLSFDRLAALPYAALPIVTAISVQSGWQMIYPRKEMKSYGTRAQIEGVYHSGDRVVVVDDLATTGGSKFEAIDKLESAGLVVEDVVVLIDRQSGAAQSLDQRGYEMHAVFTLRQLLEHWSRGDLVSQDHIIATMNFLAKNG